MAPTHCSMCNIDTSGFVVRLASNPNNIYCIDCSDEVLQKEGKNSDDSGKN